MHLRNEIIPGMILAGIKATMSFSENRTTTLWKRFMPNRKQILNTVNDKLYSAEVYPSGFFPSFDPAAKFEKWAAIEVTDAKNLPEDFEKLIIPAGEYAIFLHKGPASEGAKTYRYIFEEWLPKSGFHLDDRPHFAIMDERYKNNSEDSEEEIWIPIIRDSKLSTFNF